MSKANAGLVIPDEIVMSKIYLIRGQKVMLDKDLAELYQVETKRLKEQVKRNPERFPGHFMFELTQQENEILRSQIATSKTGPGGDRYLPMVFTEHGVLMLSNVLKSQRAITMSIKIIDVFIKLREFLYDNEKIHAAIEQIRKKTENNTKNIEVVFQYLDELLSKEEVPKKKKTRKYIGYKI